MLRIAICDDDNTFILYLKQRIKNVLCDGEEVEFYEYHSGAELMCAQFDQAEFDILFLDVQMPEMNGNEVAREFRAKYAATTLVFCSGVCLPTPETFKVTPYRYLLKQFPDQKLENELREIFEYLNRQKNGPYVWGNFKKNRYKLYLDDVSFISIVKRGCSIHLLPESTLYGLSSEMHSENKLSELYEETRGYGFTYAHNSYIVNMKYVVRQTGVEIELADGNILTVSRSRWKDFENDFSKYMASKY